MLEYRFMGPKKAQQIRLQRMQQLEEEHFYASLLLEENEKDSVAAATLAELERCIRHHAQVLGYASADPESAEAEMPSLPEEGP